MLVGTTRNHPRTHGSSRNNDRQESHGHGKYDDQQHEHASPLPERDPSDAPDRSSLRTTQVRARRPTWPGCRSSNSVATSREDREVEAEVERSHEYGAGRPSRPALGAPWVARPPLDGGRVRSACDRHEGACPRPSVDHIDHGVQRRDLEDSSNRAEHVSDRESGAFTSRLLVRGDERRDTVRIAAKHRGPSRVLGSVSSA
jgi:hypothetical protein